VVTLKVVPLGYS